MFGEGQQGRVVHLNDEWLSPEVVLQLGDCPKNGQSLAFCVGVSGFRVGKRLADEGERDLPPVLDLVQGRSQSSLASIAFEDQRGSLFWEFQERRVRHCPSKVEEGFFLHGGPAPGDIVLGQVVQRAGNLPVVLDMCVVVDAHTQEPL